MLRSNAIHALRLRSCAYTDPDPMVSACPIGERRDLFARLERAGAVLRAHPQRVVPRRGGFHTAAHSTHVYFPRGALICAGCQVFPSSAETSTALIPRSPAYAMPPSPTSSPTLYIMCPPPGVVNLDIVLTRAC